MQMTGRKRADFIVASLVLIGALNLVLVGLFGFDMVARVFEPMTIVGRFVRVILGVSALSGVVLCGLFGEGGDIISTSRLRPESSPLAQGRQ